MIRAAMLDIDGTILDSMHVWSDVDKVFLSRRGITLPDDYASAIAKMTMREGAEYTKQRFGLRESADEILDEWNDMVREQYAHHVTIKPYVDTFLHAMHSAGIKLCTVSTLPCALAQSALVRHGINALFGANIYAGDFDGGKSRPDVYLHAAKQLGEAPEDCVMYDDLPYALRGAKSAGLYAVGVFDPHSSALHNDMSEVCDRFITDFSREFDEICRL